LIAEIGSMRESKTQRPASVGKVSGALSDADGRKPSIVTRRNAVRDKDMRHPLFAI
jgi:hypothetical protein